MTHFAVSVAAESNLWHPPAVVTVEVKLTNVWLSDTLLRGGKKEARAKLRCGGCSAAGAGGGVAAHVGVEV